MLGRHLGIDVVGSLTAYDERERMSISCTQHQSLSVRGCRLTTFGVWRSIGNRLQVAQRAVFTVLQDNS